MGSPADDGSASTYADYGSPAIHSHSYLQQDHQGNMSAFMRRRMGASPVMSTMSSGGYGGGYGAGYGTSYGSGYGTAMMSSPQYINKRLSRLWQPRSTCNNRV